MADIAFDSAGILYGVGSIGGPNLYTINTSTGQATVVGSTGLTSTTGGGLAISSAGVFYGTPTSTRYGTYDSVTGAYTNIANPAKPAGGGGYSALDFNGSTLYGLNTGPTPVGGTTPPTHIVTIDPSTGTVTDFGASLDSLDAIAFQPPAPGSQATTTITAPSTRATTLCFARTWAQQTCCPTTRSAAPSARPIHSVAVQLRQATRKRLDVSAVPEPTTLVLLLAGMFAMCHGRRMRRRFRTLARAPRTPKSCDLASPRGDKAGTNNHES